MKRLAITTGLVLSVLACGCASTASGDKTSGMLVSKPVKFAKKQETTDTLVVIRYPAVVDAGANDAYHAAFERKPIGGVMDPKRKGRAEFAQTADAVIVKSNYFAMSVYKALADQLPANSVLLSPHVIKVDASGALYSEPMMATETLPNVVTVDFTAYSFPDPERMMDKEPLTFGDLVSTLVVVHTDYAAQPSTHGLLLASDSLLGSAWDTATEASRAGAAQKPQSLDFIRYISRNSASKPLTQGLSLDTKKSAVQLYGMEKIQLDAKALDKMKKDPKAQADIFADKFSKPFASRVVDLLNDIDHDQATVHGRPTAIASFDEPAAALYLASASHQDVQARMRLAGNLISAERQFLGKQSQKLYEGTYGGTFGTQVREMVAAEYDVIKKRRDMANQQNFNTGMAIFGAVLAGVAAGSAASDYSSGLIDSSTYQSLSSNATSLLTSATSLISSNDVIAAGSKALGQNFLVSIAPALNDQVTVVADLSEDSESITASNFQQFHEKAGTLYRSKIRSMEASAARCTFNHPSARAGGTWNGECKGEVASGFGSGTVQLADGSTIEYYGRAEGGLAQGVGYMVSTDAKGVQSFEGEFAGGLPNGIVSVTATGKEREVRKFQNGKDAGKAPKNAVAPSPLRASPPSAPAATAAPKAS